MAAKNPEPTWHLKLRTYPSGKFVGLWLVRRDGDAEAGLLWGELPPWLADEVIAKLNLPVEREEAQYEAVPIRGQGTLFGG